jgi:hypothetical protein
MRRVTSVLSVAALAVATALIAVPSSAATGTWTKITSPRGPGQPIYQFVNAAVSTTFTVSGSTSLDLIPGTDTINVFCFTNSDAHTTSSSPLNAAPLAIDASHNFTGTIGSTQPTCVLRAVPSTYSGLTGTDNNGYVGAFAGPIFHYGGFVNSIASGVLVGQITYGYTSNAAVQYSDPASGAVQVSFPDDAFSSSAGPPMDLANLALARSNLVPTSGTSTKSEIVIDGHNVYTPATLSAIAATPSQVPPITISRTHNAANGTFGLTETNPLRWCSGNAFPQTTGTCNMVQTGVKLLTVTTMSAGGLVVSVRQRFINTDHASHSLKVEYSNLLLGQANGEPGVMLPGQSSFSVPSPNTTKNNLPLGAHTIFTTSDIHAVDGSPDRSDGGLTYSGKPQLYFGSANTYALRYTRNIPKDGAAAFGFAVESGFSVSSVKKLAAAQQKALTDHLVITSPHGGAVISTALTKVKGKITNAVNGLPTKATVSSGTRSKTVSVHLDGTFVASLSLGAGRHTITARATDPAGNKLSDSVRIRHT